MMVSLFLIKRVQQTDLFKSNLLAQLKLVVKSIFQLLLLSDTLLQYNYKYYVND